MVLQACKILSLSAESVFEHKKDNTFILYIVYEIYTIYNIKFCMYTEELWDYPQFYVHGPHTDAQRTICDTRDPIQVCHVQS